MLACRYQSGGIEPHDFAQATPHLIARDGIAHLAAYGEPNFWGIASGLGLSLAVA